MMSRIRIFACYHKAAHRFASDFITPLQVGRALATEKLDMPGDDTGRHISEKNPFYCELTGHYWVWKNVLPDCPEGWVGLCHYRRFMDVSDTASHTVTTLPLSAFQPVFAQWQEDMAFRQVKDHDIVTSLLFPPRFCNTYEQYCVSRNRKFMDMTIRIITEKFPEYRHALQSTLAARQANLGNTFLMRKEWLDRYYTWLFTILEELEARVEGIPALRAQWAREPGHIAERLLNVWCLHQQQTTAVRIRNLPAYIIKEPTALTAAHCKKFFHNRVKLYTSRLFRTHRPPL